MSVTSTTTTTLRPPHLVTPSHDASHLPKCRRRVTAETAVTAAAGNWGRDMTRLEPQARSTITTNVAPSGAETLVLQLRPHPITPPPTPPRGLTTGPLGRHVTTSPATAPVSKESADRPT